MIIIIMSKTEQEKKIANAEYQKKHRENNIETRTEYEKQYRKDNIETLTEYEKNYKKEHADEIKKYNAKYNQDNKDKLAIKKSAKVMCECGNEYTANHKSDHIKTKKHIDKMAEKANKK